MDVASHPQFSEAQLHKLPTTAQKNLLHVHILAIIFVINMSERKKDWGGQIKGEEYNKIERKISHTPEIFSCAVIVVVVVAGVTAFSQ